MKFVSRVIVFRIAILIIIHFYVGHCKSQWNILAREQLVVRESCSDIDSAANAQKFPSALNLHLTVYYAQTYKYKLHHHQEYTQI